MNPVINKLVYYTHVYLREEFSDSKCYTRQKETEEYLNKLLEFEPQALDFYSNIIDRVEKGEGLLTKKLLINILAQRFPEATKKINYAYLLSKCI